MSIKTTVTLEHGNLTHRNAFLKDLRMLLTKWGGRAPKIKIRVVLETEAEHGMPDDLSLFELGILSEDKALTTLTPLEAALAAAAMLPSIHDSAVQDVPESEPEYVPEPVEAPAEPARLPSTSERIIQALAAHGPMSEGSLASRLFLGLDEVAAATAHLRTRGDIEPDDGGVWRLAEGE